MKATLIKGQRVFADHDPGKLDLEFGTIERPRSQRGRGRPRTLQEVMASRGAWTVTSPSGEE